MKTKTIIGFAAIMALLAANKKKETTPKQSVEVWADVESTTAQLPDKMPPLLNK